MNKSLKKILVIGNYHLSYVYSACLSNFYEITYINTDGLSKVEIFYEIQNLREPGLQKLIKTNLTRKKILLASKKDLKKYFDLIWITIDFNKFKNKSKFSLMLNRYINKYKANKIAISTQVELGTLSSLSNKFKSKFFFYIPENLRFGRAIYDFNNQSRTVIGTKNGQKDEMIEKILSPYDKNIFWTNFITSESLKMTLNLLIASQISISNELMRTLTNFDDTIDIKNLFKFIFADNRLKKNVYYNPGTAIYGETLLRESNKYNSLLNNKTSHVLKNLPLSNHSHKQWFITYLKKIIFKNNNIKKIIAFYGLQKIKKDDLLKSSILSDIHFNFKNNIKDIYIINDEKPLFTSNIIKFIKTDSIDQIKIDLIIILDKYDKNINKFLKDNPNTFILDPFMIYKKGIIYGQK